MKICYVANANSIHTKRWAEHFAGKGHEVHLISMNEDKVKGVKIHLLKPPGDEEYIAEPILFKNNGLIAFIKKIIGENSNIRKLISNILGSCRLISQDLKYARRCRRIVRELQPDILHGHFLTSYGVYAAFTGHKPLVLSAWGSDVLVHPKQSLLRKIYCKYCIRKADVVTAESKTVSDALLRLGRSGDKIIQLAWGVDCKLFLPGYPLEVKRIKAKLRIPENAVVVLSNRIAKPLYNIDCIIRSIPIVLKKTSGIYFIILCPYGIPGYRRKMEEAVAKLGFPNNVYFMPDFVSSREMAVYFNASDILLSIPTSDALSVSVFEAMACGVVPIISNVEANRELIAQGGKAFLLPDINEKELASAIIYCVENLADMKKKTQEDNRKYILKHHNWERGAESMKILYQGLLKACA